jgi:hypothetical protein
MQNGYIRVWRLEVETLIAFLSLEIEFLLVALMLIVGYQVLTGRINTKGMLFDKETQEFSPGRVQLLTLTLLTAFLYILQAAQNPAQLPEVPQELLLILGGSNLVYLVGKSSPFLPFWHSGRRDTA